MTPAIAIVSLLAFLLGGLVKGVIGLGLPTIAIAVMGVVLPPAKAAALLVVPSLVTNIWQFAAGPHRRELVRRLWPFLVAVCIGTAAGAGLLAGASAVWGSGALGATLVLYSAMGLAAVQFQVAPRTERWLGPVIGLATGVVTAATGVFVIPAVPYLQALAMSRDELVQALGLSFTVSTLAMGASLAQVGALPLPVLGWSILALAPALAGMVAGQRLRGRISPAGFRYCMLLGLLALGVHLLLRALL